MIIFRYLAKEVLTSMLAVSTVLLLIIMSGRFVRYLAEAAAGKLDADVLLTLMGFRLPEYLELILPLGLFISILLAYGRLYVDSEMTVLSACGMSERRLIAYTLMIGLIVASLVGLFSLYLGPLGARASTELIKEQRSRTEFETLKPARFHELSSGDGVSYAKSLSEDKKVLEGVFLAGSGEEAKKVTVLTAQTGETLVDKESGRRYLVLRDGHQYHGRPGDAEYEIVTFKKYSQRLPEPEYESKANKVTDGISTLRLLQTDTPQAQAALQWRISLPVLVMIVSLLAVPLSRTQPRRGRYVKMIPAILLYIIYLVLSNAGRGMLESGKAPTPYILWVVHGGYFILALILLWAPKFFQLPTFSLPRASLTKLWRRG